MSGSEFRPERPRVLIVEDDPEGRRTFERIFRRAGFDTRVARNGIDAFAAVERQRYDALVCDIRMPGLGGIGFFEQLEQSYPTMASRTVFVTAYAEIPEIAQFLEKTGQPVFGKPYDAERLVEITRLIARRREPKPD